MRILIDGTMARGGGGFTYLVNVIPRLARLAPQDEFKLLIRNEKLAEALPALPNVEVDLLPSVGVLGRLRFTHVEVPAIARRWGADVFFSAGESAPLWAPCPVVAAFRNPNVFTPIEQGWSRRQRLRLDLLLAQAKISVRSADKILFVSRDSADWIGDRLDMPSTKRAVVHHGIDSGAWQPVPGPRPHPRPYLLSVSSIYRYKNFVRLIEAYRELAARRLDVPDLVIIGDDQDPDYADRMRAAREACGALADRIHILGEVAYRDIPAWYAGAELFVFPSHLETFGHPLLEAMASEVPVVAADIPVFREVACDAALYADPNDPQSLVSAMDAALYGFEVGETLVKRGLDRVHEFTWDRSAAGLHSMLRDLLAERVGARGMASAVA